jgi:hypothetical protein
MDLEEPAEHADRLFHRARDEVLHLAGRGVRELRADGDRGVADVREEIDRKPREADPAERDHRESDHEDRHAALDREEGEAADHVVFAAAFVAA